MEIIISFHSTTHALMAHRILPEGEIIPTPRRIMASCGLSIRIAGDKEQILQELKNSGITWAVVT